MTRILFRPNVDSKSLYIVSQRTIADVQFRRDTITIRGIITMELDVNDRDSR